MESNKKDPLDMLGLKEDQKIKAYQFNTRVKQEYVKIGGLDEHMKHYTNLDLTTRFLVARKYDEKKALEMWNNYRNWRIEYKVDSITDEDIKNELKQGKAFFHGYDKKGRPCLVFKIKHHRPGTIAVEETIKFGVYLIEKGIALCEEKGSDKIVVIYDREGFDNKNFDTKLANVMRSLIKILQSFYAERLAKMYVLHPNWFYKLMYGMAKPFLDEKTKQKIHLVSKIDELKNDFDLDQLLIEHGGTSPYIYSWPEVKDGNQGEHGRIDVEDEKKTHLGAPIEEVQRKYSEEFFDFPEDPKFDINIGSHDSSDFAHELLEGDNVEFRKNIPPQFPSKF